MYHNNKAYPWHYQMNTQMQYPSFQQQYYYPQWMNQPMYQQKPQQQWKDYGPNPFVINIEQATLANNNFRTALWTGKHLQLTLMSIGVGEDIGLEVHPTLDQFIRIEEGQGIVQMGDAKNSLTFQRKISDDYAIIIPAGKWHNLINTGNTPLKLYSIYAPPQHPKGTIHQSKADALAAEKNHGY
jgi:mannose-6-phosphate isomerase-like protein (cupin superfamily)